MAKIIQKIQQILVRYMNAEHQRRIIRRRNHFDCNLEYFSSLSKEDLLSEYIEIKSKYEHKRMLFVGVAITLIATVTLAIWKSIISSMKSLLFVSIGATQSKLLFLMITIGILASCPPILILYQMSSYLSFLGYKKTLIEVCLKDRLHLSNTEFSGEAKWQR